MDEVGERVVGRESDTGKETGAKGERRAHRERIKDGKGVKWGIREHTIQ